VCVRSLVMILLENTDVPRTPLAAFVPPDINLIHSSRHRCRTPERRERLEQAKRSFAAMRSQTEFGNESTSLRDTRRQEGMREKESAGVVCASAIETRRRHP